MTPGRLVAVLAALAVAAFAVLAGADGDRYAVEMRLDNAGGLRSGSPVVVGGLPIGTVDLEAARDGVRVRLEIDDEHAPIGRDTSAAIVAQNILGQKQVQLRLGEEDPAPDGFVLPARNVAETTDLDQVLAALDTDTRGRLAIALNELGTTFMGRRFDLQVFLRDFAPALGRGREMLEELATDTRALGRLVETSDRYVAELAEERSRLVEMLDSVEGAAESVAGRRGELERTLRSAPAALRSTRQLLTELRRATQPLARTGRRLHDAGPPLVEVLDAIAPFRHAAEPTLDEAHSVGPKLVSLAQGATPVVEKAAGTLAGTRSLGENEVPPVGRTLDRSMNNVIATVENWARAIQFRDRMGHVFRGEASFSPDALEAALRRLTPRPARRREKPSRSAPPREAPAPAPGTAAPQAPAKPERPALLPDLDRLLPGVEKLVPELEKALPETLDELPLGDLLPGPRGSGSRAPKGGAEPLLDYLLGSDG